MYNLEFLPSAQQDLVEIVGYISRDLNNPTAANDLATEIIEVTNKLTDFPYANPSYIPIKPLKHEYRKVLIKNYLLFYWIDEDKKLITVARAIYAKRDYGVLLK